MGDGEANWLTAYGIGDSAPSEQWMVSVYWAVTLLTTVGYGDVLPVNTSERLLNVLCMLVGALVFGKIVGDITTVVADLSKEKTLRREKLQKLNKALQYKIRKTYFDNYDNASLRKTDDSAT